MRPNVGQLLYRKGARRLGWEIELVSQPPSAIVYQVSSVMDYPAILQFPRKVDAMTSFESRKEAVEFVRREASHRFFKNVEPDTDTLDAVRAQPKCYTAANKFDGGGKGFPACGGCDLRDYCSPHASAEEDEPQEDPEVLAARAQAKLKGWD